MPTPIPLGPYDALPVNMQFGFKKSRTREDLKRNTLITLGAPTINIEITNAQLESCINNALRVFLQHHRSGSFENYYAVSLDAEQARLGFCRVPENIDAVLEVIHVGPLGAVGSGNGEFAGNPADGSTALDNITNSAGGMNFTSIAWQLTAQAYAGTNMAIGPLGQSGKQGGGSVNGMGVLSGSGGTAGTMSWADYQKAKMFMDTMIFMSKAPRRFVFARYQRKINLLFPTKPGDVICFRVYENLDPDKNPELCGEMFDDYTLQNLVTAHVKVVWGSVLRKFGGIALPGGVMLEGDTLVAEGKAEIDQLIEKLGNSQPVEFFIG